MEKHMQYLMWVKSKAPVMMGSTSLKRSWEEEELAFAEDIGGGGVLGGGLGFVWPPRSYSCTFCRREFRSAQALGGHMNVHRRDRARLKQSLTLSSNETTPHQKITTPSSSNLHLHPQDGNFSSKKVTQENSNGQKCARRKELEEEIMRMRDYKRHKKSGISSSSVGFLHKQCSSNNNNNRYIIQPAEGLRIIKANNISSLEDIDLELRLGDSPAVK